MNRIEENEIALLNACFEHLKELKVQKARATLNKSVCDLIGTLNGEVDKVSRCMDRSITFCLFADNRFGTFSTNCLKEKELFEFLDKAVSTVKMLCEDPLRDLPSPERKVSNAAEGTELKLYDCSYGSSDPEQKLQSALQASIFGKTPENGAWHLISEEAEYSENMFDSITIDSEGLFCRHSETSFEYGTEMTIEDKDGEKFSGYWWHASPFRKDLEISGCAEVALNRAIAQMNPKPVNSGKKNLVIDTEVASKVVSPILNALNGYSLQQQNSFLTDSLDKQMFPEGLTIMDLCHREGETGSRLFDSEGVATVEDCVIEKGIVKKYFINTYMSGKMNIAPTIEDVARPCLMPWPEKGLRKPDILKLCGNGILVTSFNGGNSNPATGDFSYGIEGFAFENGEITHPVHEMVITGNFLKLWKGLIAIGEDARGCMSKLIPTLAFADVDISA